jgi:hypothetical protein
MIAEATELLGSIKKFNTAQTGDSGDAEIDAACEMRDAALAFMLKVSERGVELAELIDNTDIEAEEPAEPEEE